MPDKVQWWLAEEMPAGSLPRFVDGPHLDRKGVQEAQRRFAEHGLRRRYVAARITLTECDTMTDPIEAGVR